MRKLMLLIAVAVLAVGGIRALAGDAGGKTVKPRPLSKEEKQRVKLRLANRKLYNGVYQASLLQEPKQAKVAFARVQQKMEQANPKDAGDISIGQALFQRGYLAMETKDYSSALKLFADLVKRFPKHAYADDALYQIGHIYQHKLKDFDKAAAAYDKLARTKAYRTRENAPNAMMQNAQVAVQQGRFNDVVANLNDTQTVAIDQRARRKQSSTPSYYERQSQQILKFIDRNKGNKKDQEALVYWMRGDNNLKQGNVKNAARDFSQIQKKYARSKLADDATFGLAECRRKAGKLDKAVELYAAFLEKYPRSEYAPLAKFRLAEFKRVAGDTQAARKLYQGARADIARTVAEGLKKKPPIKREDISPEVRRVLELSKDRIMEMSRAKAAQ